MTATMPKARTFAVAACAVLAASLAVVAVATFAGDDEPGADPADSRLNDAGTAATRQKQARGKTAAGQDEDDCCGGEESGVRSSKKPNEAETSLRAEQSEHSHEADG